MSTNYCYGNLRIKQLENEVDAVKRVAAIRADVIAKQTKEMNSLHTTIGIQALLLAVISGTLIVALFS